MLLKNGFRPVLIVFVTAGLLVANTCSAIASAPAASRAATPFDDEKPELVAVRRTINLLLELADSALDHRRPRQAEALKRVATRLECRFFGCPPASGDVTIAMDPAASDFMAMPWPEDTRRRADGAIDLTGFPGRDASPILDVVLGRAEVVTNGFGTNSAVYMQTTGVIDASSLPTPDASVGQRSPVMLLDLDDPRAAPVPLLTNYKERSTLLRPANLVTLLPYPGHPLAQGHRYAAVAFDGLLDSSGRALARTPLLDALTGRPPSNVESARWSQLRSERDDMMRAVRTRTLWHPTEIVAFTVFTTQIVSRELEAIAAAVDALPSPAPIARTTADCSQGTSSAIANGELDLPKWQAGASPYLEQGGAIVVGSDGRAARQGTERVLFEMAIPCAPAPPTGWPILLYMNGTGASANAAYISELGSPPLPYLVLSIAPLYSGDRAVGSDPSFAFFNYLNPLAGRTNQLQQAADMLYLKRIAQGLQVHASEGVAAVPPRIDRETIVVAGHSQGALTLPHLLSVDPTIDGAFLSSGGAGLYHSIVHRADVSQLVHDVVPAEPGELDMFHPLVHVLQTAAEIGDGANYAPRARSSDLALYAGLIDGCSPIEASVHLAQALGVEIANPVGGPVFGSKQFEPDTVGLPVTANLPDGRTGVMIELDQGHFGATTNPTIGRSFVDSIARGGPATVDPGPLDQGFPSSGCSGRADPPPPR